MSKPTTPAAPSSSPAPNGSRPSGDAASSGKSRSDPPLWRTFTRRVAWPTVVLAVLVVVGYVGVVAWAVAGDLSWWVASPLLAALAYIAFTPMHEASHANISGSVRGWRWLDPVVGWSMALIFAAPFPAFRAVHLRHHGRTNHLDDDPDAWVAGNSWWSIVLRCWTIFPHYDLLYLRRLMWLTPAAQREGYRVIAAFVGIGLLIGGLVTFDYGAAVLALWVAPLWLASGFLALAFDWLPHVPHQRTGRYVDTRAIDVRWLDAPLLGQNLHAVHHLYPRVPFYRYRPTFDAMAPELEAKGTEVFRFRSTQRGAMVR